MNNFDHYITPREAYKRDLEIGQTGTSVEYYEELAKVTEKCSVCGMENQWRYAGTGMCFSCTTGEWDASEDYELISG